MVECEPYATGASSGSGSVEKPGLVTRVSTAAVAKALGFDETTVGDPGSLAGSTTL